MMRVDPEGQYLLPAIYYGFIWLAQNYWWLEPAYTWLTNGGAEKLKYGEEWMRGVYDPMRYDPISGETYDINVSIKPWTDGDEVSCGWY